MVQDSNNSEYRTTIGSDVNRDVFFAELARVANGQIELMAEAFYNDRTAKFTFNACGKDIPFDVVERFVQEARQRVPPMKPTGKY